MILAPQKKLRIVLILMLVILFLVVAIPFFISGGTLAVLYIVYFLAIAYLWSEFNKLRISVNKKELEDESLTGLEHDVEKLANLEFFQDNKK